MSEKTADLWARAEDCDEAPIELEAALEERNRAVDWDREVLISESSAEREQLSADD